MPKIQERSRRVEELDIPLERDGFLRTLLRELSGALQDIVGLEETIARVDPGCRVVAHLRPTAEARTTRGREYFRRPDEG